MHKLKEALIILFILVSISFSYSQETVKYHNKTDGYSVVFPADWDIQEDYMGASVIALSPQETGDTIRENVNVVIQPMVDEMTLDEYVDFNISSMEMYLTDFSVEDSEPVLINGIEAELMIYYHTMGRLRFKVMVYIFIFNNTAYAVTCTAVPDSFELFREVFEKIVLSFHMEK